MIRGGDVPNQGIGPRAAVQIGPAARSFAADAYGRIMVRAPHGPPDTSLRRDDPRARWRAPLGLVRNRLSTELNLRNVSAELEP